MPEDFGVQNAEPADVELPVVLRRVRRQHGLSQRDLQRSLHLGSHSVIVDWEAGRRLPPATILSAYEKHFGLASRELQTLRERILAERATADSGRRVAEPSSATALPFPIPRQLPGASAHFVGRVMALAELDRLAGEAYGPGVVVVSAIGGMAGIGKTALAIEFGHRAAGQFPDGQLYVNLRGFGLSRQPLAPTAALRGFLGALGVPAVRIPPDTDRQARLYRSLLADRRMLIVADNARDAAQVRPLLPGTAGCLVLVTSRSQLSGLAVTDGANLIDLDLLTPTEARDLLAARIGSGRVAGEPQATEEIIARCERLPLALAIAAARAAARPTFPLHAIASELRGGRLDALSTGDDPASDARAVFSWSYRTLTPAAARMFRLLGSHPGPDISSLAAVSLVGLPASQTRLLLAELAKANLISEPVPSRYTLHDLLRAYADQLAQAEDSVSEREAAVERVLDHYLRTAHQADRLLNPARDPITIAPPRPGSLCEEFEDHHQALAWFAAEHHVLLAAVEYGAAAGLDVTVWQLAWALWTYFDRQGHWHDQVTVQRIAVAAGERLGDLQTQARAHRLMASAYPPLGRLSDAAIPYEHALDLYRRCGDQAGQAHSHLSLAIVRTRGIRYEEALEHLDQALLLYRAAGHLRGQADTLNSAGWTHAQRGDNAQALTSCYEALALYRELEDQTGQAHTWDSLGCAHQHLGHYDDAIECYRLSLALYRDLGERFYQADTFTRLGDTYQALGDSGAAQDAWQQSLVILEELGHPDAEQVRAKLGCPGGAAAATPPN